VLLIIFMVTAPMIQRGVDVKLPVARNAGTVEGERVFVTIPATYKTDGMIYVNSDRVRVEVLADSVRQKVQAAVDKQVYLRGDGTVQLQELMAIFDRLRDAGVKDVGIVTRAPGDL
jgi:biopolymer transport protein TolR